MKRWVLLYFLLPVLAIGIQAAQFIPMSIEDMGAKAELIVRGRVAEKSFGQDAEGRIYTRIRLAVAETWKGKAADVVEIVHSGGRFGGRTAITSGQVEYAPGEEVVAFLVLNSKSQAVTLGLAQGKFHVWKDSITGQTMARNLFHGNAPQGSGLGETLKTQSGASATTNNTGKLSIATLKQLAIGGVK